MILFGRGYPRSGWALNSITCVLTREEKERRHRGEGHVKMEGEIEVI